jgi:hypothetical protein
MAPPLQHVLYHWTKDRRETHHVQTVCNLSFESWDPPNFDETEHPTCMLCWRGMQSPYAPHGRIVRGMLVELYHDSRIP